MGLLHPFPHRYVLLLKLSIISAKVLLLTDYVFRCNKEGVALLVGLKRRFQPQPISSLARNPETEGISSFLTHHRPSPSLETRDGGSFFLPTTTHLLPHSKRETEGVSSFPIHHRPSPSLETQDGGSFFLPTISSLAQNTRRRGFPPSQPTTIPLPRSKHETEGSFFLPTHHRSPPSLKARDGRGFRVLQPTTPRSNCETESFLLPNPPPSPLSLEARDGGGFRVFRPTPVPLARSNREAGPTGSKFDEKTALSHLSSATR